MLSIALVGAALLLIFVTAWSCAEAVPRDLTSFWLAAHEIERNPYLSSIGMRNPPWALLFVLPLRAFDFPSAFAFWTVVSLTIVAGCGRVLWGLYSRTPSVLPAVLTLVFAPTVSLIIEGQLSALVLLGITLFLYAVDRKQDWLMGVSLLFVAVKPHVAALFLLAVALWVLWSKKWTVCYGAVTAVGASSLVALSLNSHIFSQYFAYAPSSVFRNEIYPSLGGVLFALSGNRWVALLPEIAGLIWLPVYLWRHRMGWNWKTHGITVILISLVCCFYAYPYDEVIVLPALVAALAQEDRCLAVSGLVLVNTGYILYLSNVAGKLGFGHPLFLSWTGAAWLLTYVLSRRRTPLAAVAGD